MNRKNEQNKLWEQEKQRQKNEQQKAPPETTFLTWAAIVWFVAFVIIFVYLKKLEPKTFAGHSSRVTSAAFSPDGKTALSGSGDNTLKLWDIQREKN